MKHIILGITGASGAPYARRLAQELARGDVHVHLVISSHGARVLREELDLRELNANALLGRGAANFTTYSHRDIGARIASGSFLTHGMVICPCSAHTLGAIAGGLGDNLIARAAHVTLKESRRLVLVPREMPLSQIDLANMLKASEAGAVVCPAMPGFYLRPTSVAQIVDFVVGRVLDLLGFQHDLRIRWRPDEDSDALPSSRNVE